MRRINLTVLSVVAATVVTITGCDSSDSSYVDKVDAYDDFDRAQMRPHEINRYNDAVEIENAAVREMINSKLTDN